jgi:WD repeat-containing protein 48
VNSNQTVLSASSDGTVKAWSPHSSHSSAHEPALVGTHADYVRCLAHSRERGWIASGGFDRTIKLWDISRAHTTPPANPVTSVFSQPHGTHITQKDPEPLMTLSAPDTTGPKASIYALACDPAGLLLASGSPERVVRLWDARSGKRTAKLVGHTDNIRSLVLSDDGRWLLSASSDASIKLWSVAAQRCLHTFTHHTESVWSLFSDHPTLEVFCSGDRSGLVCRVDVEGCADVSEGECVLLARVGASSSSTTGGPPEGDEEEEEAPTDGVTAIVCADDRLLWTASGTSSIARYRVPQRRSARVIPASYSPPAAGIRSSQDRRMSVAHSIASIGSPLLTDPGSNGMMRAGLPLDSLIRLQSATDPFAPLPRATYPAGARDDVATLYSAASVMSVPRQTGRTPLSAGFPLSAGSANAMYSADDETTALANYEIRELAVDALPLLPSPIDVISGESGLVRSMLLNDRLHALTVDTAGSVCVFDIVRGTCLGAFAPAAVRAAVAAHLPPDAPAHERRSPREALEAVRARIEGEAVVNGWCSLETRTGVLQVHLTERCFEAEIYADEAGYDESGFNDEQRLNVGKWVLRNLFEKFVREEQRTQRRMQEQFGGGAVAGLGTPGQSFVEFNATRSQLIRNTSSSSLSSMPTTPSIPNYHSALSGPSTTAPNMLPAIPPPMAHAPGHASVRASPLITSMAQLQSPAMGLSPIPQSPSNQADDLTTPMPRRSVQTPGASLYSEDGLRVSSSVGKDDYFSMRSRQTSGQQPTSPSEDSVASGGVPGSPVAAATPGASLMGKLKSFGRGRRTASELTVAGPVATVTADDAIPQPSPNQLALQALLSAPLTPPTTTDAPSLVLAPFTRLIVAEEAPPSWRPRVSTTVGGAGADMRLIEDEAPRWLLEYLLGNKTPQVGVAKVGFVLVPYEQGSETLPELLNASVFFLHPLITKSADHNPWQP